MVYVSHHDFMVMIDKVEAYRNTAVLAEIEFYEDHFRLASGGYSPHKFPSKFDEFMKSLPEKVIFRGLGFMQKPLKTHAQRIADLETLDYWIKYANHLLYEYQSCWDTLDIGDFEVLFWMQLFKTPCVPQNMIRVLATHTNAEIREEVASYGNTPIDILDYLSNDSYEGVLASVICNPNCTERIRLNIALRCANTPEGQLHHPLSILVQISQNPEIEKILRTGSNPRAKHLSRLIRIRIIKNGLKGIDSMTHINNALNTPSYARLPMDALGNIQSLIRLAMFDEDESYAAILDEHLADKPKSYHATAIGIAMLLKPF